MAEKADPVLAGKIGIVGSGVVGRSWCLLFISRHHPVCLYDSDPDQLFRVVNAIYDLLIEYEKCGYLKGDLSAEEQFKLISVTDELKVCVKDAIHVQECVYEDVEVKRTVLTQIDKLIDDVTIVGSSSSCIPSSAFTEKCSHRGNMLIVHPVNPPYFVPLVEVVRAPWTTETTVNTTCDLMTSIGQCPIRQKETPGFIINRLQYALINECWNLAKEGVASVEDIDKAMSEGMGMRYAFLGPLETARLNADGMEDYMTRYGAGMHKVNKTFLPTPEYTPEEAKQVETEMAKTVPLDKIGERKKWRDRKIAELSLLKRGGSSGCKSDSETGMEIEK